ncbi:MAG: hypothetical protein FWB71_02080 [Defluviitaleaceae bacterium]|nr:hypothetical protein [Defluviitaleaceae bacterium]
MGGLSFLVWYIPLAIICYFLSALIHELGHVVVGLRHGWRLDVLIIGPLGIKRNESDKLDFCLEKNPSMWGGAAAAFPVKADDENNLKIFSKTLLGGPIASILMGIIFLAVCFFHFHIIWLLLALMPLGLGIVCMLPMKNGFTYTDGKRWLRLRDGAKGRAEETALWKIAEFSIFKKNIETIQKEDFEALLDAEHPAHRYYGYFFQYLYYSFQNDLENKEKAFNDLQELKKSVHKSIISGLEGLFRVRE